MRKFLSRLGLPSTHLKCHERGRGRCPSHNGLLPRYASRLNQHSFAADLFHPFARDLPLRNTFTACRFQHDFRPLSRKSVYRGPQVILHTADFSWLGNIFNVSQLKYSKNERFCYQFWMSSQLSSRQKKCSRGRRASFKASGRYPRIRRSQRTSIYVCVARKQKTARVRLNHY